MPDYNKYKGQIHSLAYKWSRVLGQDADDLFSEGNLVFCSVAGNWDESRGKFTTFLQTCIVNHFKSLTSNNRERAILIEELPEGTDIRTPEKSYELKSMIESMSEEAQEVVDIVINGPKELGQISNVQSYLRECGWAWETIWGSVREIKAIFN